MLTKLKAIWAVVKTELATIWDKSRMYIIGLVVILATLEWRRIKEALIVAAGAREIKNANTQDGKLASQENTDKQQAQALEQKAQNEPNPSDDWNKS